MARIRTIKPEFTRDEEFSRLPAVVQLFAAGLICEADDYGYFKANPKLLQADIFPLRDLSQQCSDESCKCPHHFLSVPEILQSLQGIGFIELCAGTDGKVYGRIVKFSEHQRVNHPTPSKIQPLWNPQETFLKPQEDFSLEGKGKEQGTGKGNDGKPLLEFPKPQNPESLDDFDGQDWCLKTLRAYPGSDKSIAVPPPFLADLYHQLLDREAPAHGGKLAAAEWFLGVVQRYATEHASGDFVMGLEKYLRGGYMQAAKGPDVPAVAPRSVKLYDPDSGEEIVLPA